METAVKQIARLGGLPASHHGEQQHVFDDFALRAAAADPGDIAGYRLEKPHALDEVVVRERKCCQADRRDDRSCR